MGIRKFGAGEVLGVDQEDEQGLPVEQIQRTASRSWTPQDAAELDDESHDNPFAQED